MSKALRLRAKRLSPLIRIAEKAVKEALTHLGALQKQFDGERQRKDELLLYQKEYQAGFNHSGRDGIMGTRIQQHEYFMLQIDQALQAQNAHLNELDRQLQKARILYQQLNAKLNSYQTLKDRILSQAQMLEDKQLQNLLDELATQQSIRHAQSDL